MAAERPAYIVGVGMTKFVKPRPSNDYVDMGLEACVRALLDARITYDDVQQAMASYCYGDSTCGQRILYQLGMTQIPIYNVNNNCASGSTALVMARDTVRLGAADCVLAIGFEKMSTGSLSSKFDDRTDPLDRAKLLSDQLGSSGRNAQAPFAAKMFGDAAEEYITEYGATRADFGEIARVNHRHSRQNPYAQFQAEYSLDEILESPSIYGVLTKLQCCPTSDGAAAAVIVSQTFLESHPHLRTQAVEIVGQKLATDSAALYQKSAMNLVGYSMVAYTAAEAFRQAKAGIEDVKVIELHDCFSANEMLVIDAIGLSERGKAHEYVRKGGITYGSDKAVINLSGGLISKGHPLGATGIAQCAELVWQLRGWANNRFVSVSAGKLALQQNAGLGGACVVTLLRRADGQSNKKISNAEVERLSGLRYNPAVTAKGLTLEQLEKVRSHRWCDWAVGRGQRETSKVEARV